MQLPIYTLVLVEWVDYSTIQFRLSSNGRAWKGPVSKDGVSWQPVETEVEDVQVYFREAVLARSFLHLYWTLASDTILVDS